MQEGTVLENIDEEEAYPVTSDIEWITDDEEENNNETEYGIGAEIKILKIASHF